MSATGSTYRENSPTSTNRSSRTSTTSASTNHSSSNSQDYGKNGRSRYRLFPIVEPTPPSSPILLHRRTSASGPCRRRSISLGPGVTRRASGEASHFAHGIASYNSSRPSDSDVRSLLTVEECDHHGEVSTAPRVSTPLTKTFNARDAFARSQRVLEGSVAEVKPSESPTGNATGRGATTTTSISDPVGLGLRFPLVPANNIPKIVRGRAKSKPNLRISVSNACSAKGAEVASISPVHSREASIQFTSVETLSPPTSPDPALPTRGAPDSPDAVQPSGSWTSGTGGCSRTPTKSSVNTPHAQQAASSAERGRLGPLSNVCGSVSKNSGPVTSHYSSSQPPTSRRLVRVTSLPSPKLNAMSCDGHPSKPYFAHPDPLFPSASSIWSNFPSIDSRFATRVVKPDPFIARSSSSATLNSGRPSTSQGIVEKDRLAVPSTSNMPGLMLQLTPDSTDWRFESAALSAARAKVAALRSTALSARSNSLSDAISANGDIASHNPLRPLADVDPTHVLEQLNEESEALNARQANLRAERQRLSNGIIARLKNAQTTPDFLDQLLNDQLALAAINSSMDICWAKLRSLECQREDAVAALLSSAQNSRQTSDNIASMISNMALSSRKLSFSYSADAASQAGVSNGRSTPDQYYTHRQATSVKKQSFSSDGDSAESRPFDRICKDGGSEKHAPQISPVESLPLVDEIGGAVQEDNPVSAFLSPQTDLEDMFNTADGAVPRTMQIEPDETQKFRLHGGGSGRRESSRLFGLRGVKSMQTLPQKKSGIFEKTHLSKRPESPASQRSATSSKRTVSEKAGPSNVSTSAVPQTTAPPLLKSSASTSNIRTTTFLRPRPPPTQYTALSSNPLTPKLPDQTFEPPSPPSTVANQPIVQRGLPSFGTVPVSTVADEETDSPIVSPLTPEDQDTLPATMTCAPDVKSMARFSVLESDILSNRDLNLQLLSFPPAPVRAAPEVPSGLAPSSPSNSADSLPPRSSSRNLITRMSPPSPKYNTLNASQKTGTRESELSDEVIRKETQRSARAIRAFMERGFYVS